MVDAGAKRSVKGKKRERAGTVPELLKSIS